MFKLYEPFFGYDGYFGLDCQFILYLFQVQRDFEELPSEAFRPLRDSLNVSEHPLSNFLHYGIMRLILIC